MIIELNNMKFTDVDRTDYHTLAHNKIKISRREFYSLYRKSGLRLSRKKKKYFLNGSREVRIWVPKIISNNYEVESPKRFVLNLVK